jgi:hypothetical protein
MTVARVLLFIAIHTNLMIRLRMVELCLNSPVTQTGSIQDKVFVCLATGP